ncbi:unnamed protein product [Adineta ricciae]|uniref:AIG1-type G domain-containing protein n=1 Tax=Adineta ricciae TaxID=249248 RepID=A0A814X4M5_ADIRI|nr:unnamed protein product [Adineta ricciae]CAF1458265.1 unnamed protein product [Adineta ricciae]
MNLPRSTIDHHDDGKEELPSINILFVGSSQSGKSTLIKVLENQDYKSSHTGFSETKQPCFKSFTVTTDPTNPAAIVYLLNIIDTPGLKEIRRQTTETRTDDELLSDIDAFIRHHFDRLHCLCFVAEAGRVHQKDLEIFEKLMNFFGPKLSAYSMLILTSADKYTNEKLEEFKNDIRDHQLSKRIYNYCKLGIYYHGIPNYDDLDTYADRQDMLQKILVTKQQHVRPMTKMLIAKLIQCSQHSMQLRPVNNNPLINEPTLLSETDNRHGESTQSYAAAIVLNTIAGVMTTELFCSRAYNNSQLEFSNTLAQKFEHTSPVNLKAFPNAMDKHGFCDKIQHSFKRIFGYVIDAVGSLLEVVNAETGKSFKDKWAGYIEEDSNTNQVVAMKGILEKYLKQEELKRREILRSVEQEKANIRRSILRAYKLQPYLISAITLINLIMTVITHKNTRNIFIQQRKVMNETKALLEQSASLLNDYYKEAKELMESLKSIDKQELDTSVRLSTRVPFMLHLLLHSQKKLERTKSQLELIASKLCSQKNVHTVGMYSTTICTLCNTATIRGQKASLWYMAGIALGLFMLTANGISIYKCKKDSELLLQSIKETEELIANADKSIKLLQI